MKRKLFLVLLLALSVPQLYAFCGFYVAKADASLFNHKSQVIVVRDGNRNIITMSSDFKGDVKDFAMVVPVPVLLKENDIRVVNRNIFDKLDAYSAPRLVEYYDDNPCYQRYYNEDVKMSSMAESSSMPTRDMVRQSKSLGVTIEASYSIGEYDILILSAKESGGLTTWLNMNDYKVPDTAKEVLEPYIKNNLKFFVVKVNLSKMTASGFDYLNPLQISFESERFMLPIRLGMANAESAQDMIVYAFTRNGRVETVNYRTVKIPSNRNIPLFVQPDFGKFYKDLFERTYEREGRNAVFLEYAWNVSPNAGVKCDPCVAQPPVFADFRDAGVDWANDMSEASSVFFTRLHVRYTRDKFPQDLMFQVTPNRETYQARYILTHPAQGDLSCEAGQSYLKDLTNRRKREVDELTALAGWRKADYYKYIYHYSDVDYRDEIREKRNEFWIFGAISNKPPRVLILALVLAVCSVISVGWLFSKFNLKA
jgi:hypothetical protein